MVLSIILEHFWRGYKKYPTIFGKDLILDKEGGGGRGRVIKSRFTF